MYKLASKSALFLALTLSCTDAQYPYQPPRDFASYNDSPHKELTIKTSGIDRQFHLIEPKTRKGGPNEKIAAIIAIHGLQMTPELHANVTGYWKSVDALNFAAVYPVGTDQSWNGGECCPPAYLNEVNDVGFISDLIDDLVANHNVDADRVFVAGWSNGAVMTYRVGCQLSSKIKAMTTYAGGFAGKKLSTNTEWVNQEGLVSDQGTFFSIKEDMKAEDWLKIDQLYKCDEENGKKLNVLSIHGKEDMLVTDKGGVAELPLDETHKIRIGFSPDELSNWYFAQLSKPGMQPGKNQKVTYEKQVGTDEMTCKQYLDIPQNVTYCLGTGNHGYYGQENRYFQVKYDDEPLNKAFDISLQSLQFFCQFGLDCPDKTMPKPENFKKDFDKFIF